MFFQFSASGNVSNKRFLKYKRKKVLGLERGGEGERERAFTVGNFPFEDFHLGLNQKILQIFSIHKMECRLILVAKR